MEVFDSILEDYEHSVLNKQAEPDTRLTLEDLKSSFKSQNFKHDAEFYEYMAYVFYCGKEKSQIEMLHSIIKGSS